MNETQAREYLTQGKMLAGQGNHEEALAYFDKAEHKNPMVTELYLAKGVALSNLERFDEAEEQFAKALKINRFCAEAYFHIGNIAILQGDTASGLDNYNKAADNGYDEAQLYYGIGLLYEDKGETDEAIKQYSRTIKQDTAHFDARIRIANLMIQDGRVAEGLQELDEAIRANPEAQKPYHVKIAFLIQFERFAEAAELLEGAIAIFDEDAEFALDKAALYTGEGEYEKALSVLKEIESSEASDDEILRRVYMDRAHMYTLKDDFDSAISSLKQAEKLSEDKSGFDDEVVFMLANCYFATEKFDDLLACARNLLEKAGDGYIKETARYFEPFALKKLGRASEAMALYEEAVDEFRRQSLDSNGRIDAYLLRATCLRDIGQFDKALELVDYVDTVRPGMPEIHMLRASIFEQLGRESEAQEEMKAANAKLPEELRK